MHPKYQRANELSKLAIGAGIEVHRDKGPGLIESIYEKCFAHELTLQGIRWDSQQPVRISYKDLTFEEPLRYDVLIESCLLIELKAVEKILPIHRAQLMSYMKLLDVPLGLIMNFNSVKLTDDIHRMLLPGSAD
ncbi:GxxExxY protein [Cerasicoccus fimbriatus]|uniref:GxxExxY protein n=1 Tax=Cerasicoccus fimbriatus TaxID=3014554 RepID=UPI0022B4556C|nr:GxxExxY protein [Cerasicoccus sp. TK19100]